MEDAGAPSHKPQALKRRQFSKAKAKAAPEADAKAAPGGKAKAKAAAEAKAKAMAVPAEEKAKAMAVPAMAAPAVEPLAVAAPGDCAGLKKGALSMSRKCVTLRAYCAGKAKAKADGKSAAECTEAAKQAYQEAAQKWDQEHA